ncbi:MAG: hypothetical protein R2730_06340 [Chitinophagales bacterium]
MVKHKVKINWNHTFWFKLSMFLLMLSILGFIFVEFIHFPVKNLPLPIVIAYYDILPRWLTKSLVLPFILMIISLILGSITISTKASLQVKNDLVEIIWKRNNKLQIHYCMLLRIAFVQSKFSISRYRIEFVYDDMKCHRVILNNLNQSIEILDELVKVVPDNLSIEIFEMQSPQAISPKK